MIGEGSLGSCWLRGLLLLWLVSRGTVGISRGTLRTGAGGGVEDKFSCCCTLRGGAGGRMMMVFCEIGGFV